MTRRKEGLSKKKQVLEALFQHCLEQGDMTFGNDVVNRIAKEKGFKNHFDAVKIDRRELLPDTLMERDYVLAHVGGGYHQFIKGVDVWYHSFEGIAPHERKKWAYRPSILNHVNDSESNMISMCFNQRVTYDFLYNDTSASPLSYNAHRTKMDVRYYVKGDLPIEGKRVQVEIDATYEHDGVVTVLEAKNGFGDNFSLYQLFHPYLYYRGIQKNDERIKAINCCYLLGSKDKKMVRLYLYDFRDDERIGSIRLLKKAEYQLVHGR
ncbi:MAG: hypothetical protein GDA54_02695 [Alphaproteobacteria bacterium GM7ARS4]|nr:hypothetical protein [Alphaproteobacteria bacterium GM7ARS4]